MVSSNEIIDIIAISMRDAFLAVTVFVAAMVLLFSWLQYITAGKFVDTIRNNTVMQPVIGALMGITPGCGGAIVMMPMYARGYVTYGTVIATLIATLGDAAFVLIGVAITDSSFIAPVIAVHLISLIVGISWGYLVDVMKITPRNPLGILSRNFKDNISSKISIDNNQGSREVLEDLGREEENGWGYFLLHQGYTIWWIVTALGLAFAIMLLIWSAQDANFSLE